MRVPTRERPQHVTERTRSNERSRIDQRSVGEEISIPQPVGQRVRGGDGVHGPDRDFRVDEVLDEIEWWRCGRAACRLEAGRNLNHSVSMGGACDTVKTMTLVSPLMLRSRFVVQLSQIAAR